MISLLIMWMMKLDDDDNSDDDDTFTRILSNENYDSKTLPEAQRTQGIASLT